MESGSQHPQEDGQRCRITPEGAWVVQPQMPAEPSSQEKLALDSIFEEFSGSWRGGASGALLSYRSPARECEEELGPAVSFPVLSRSRSALEQRWTPGAAYGVDRAQAPGWQSARAE